MNRRNFIKATTLVSMASCFPNLLLAKPGNNLPNVLIIGDSISIGYTPIVKKILEGKANVFRPVTAEGGRLNCEGTTKGVKMIDEWLAANKWDVIHFNFGLHDLKHVNVETGKNSTSADDPQQADLKSYKKNMKVIVEKLKATGAHLIFATTTPYPDKPAGPLRRTDQPEKYNKVALKIMKKNDIKIDKLHDFIEPQLLELQKPNNVHFTQKGSEVLAKQVAQSIQEFL